VFPGVKSEGYGKLAWDVHSYVPKTGHICGYGSTVRVRCMMWMTGVWIWRSCNIELGPVGRLDAGDSGGVDCALGECVAKISTLYICINPYAPE
jgi:hypothetical protein